MKAGFESKTALRLKRETMQVESMPRVRIEIKMTWKIGPSQMKMKADYSRMAVEEAKYDSSVMLQVQ